METYEWYYARGGEQQGPVSEEDLIDLIASGAVHAGDLVWHEGMPEWRPARDMSELAGAFREAVPMGPGDVPPPPPLMTGGQGVETNPLAIASLVLAILSLGCGCLMSVPAVVCGHIALSQIKSSPERYKGRELAVASLVIGYLTLVLYLILAIFQFSFIFGNMVSSH